MRLLPLLTLFSTSAAVSALALPQQPIPQYSFPPDNPDEQTTPEEVPPEQDVSTPPEAPPPTNPSGPNFLQSLTLLGIGSAMTLGAGKAREVMRKMADNKAEEEDLMRESRSTVHPPVAPAVTRLTGSHRDGFDVVPCSICRMLPGLGRAPCSSQFFPFSSSATPRWLTVSLGCKGWRAL